MRRRRFRRPWPWCRLWSSWCRRPRRNADFTSNFRGLHQGTVMKFRIFDTGNSVDQIGLFHMWFDHKKWCCQVEKMGNWLKFDMSFVKPLKKITCKCRLFITIFGGTSNGNPFPSCIHVKNMEHVIEPWKIEEYIFI